jgi:hypothetical protein
MSLGGGPSLLEPLPGKPPGMHRLTYDRLLARAMTMQERWIGLQRDYLRRRFRGVLRDENVTERRSRDPSKDLGTC